MHRWSQLFIPTLREAPADAEVASHKFLVRAGYIRQLGAGIYSHLFLGERTILRITQVVREEMDKIGQEFLLPALHPRELWEASGRWAVMGDNMFRLKDRGGRDLALGMTHEEVMTEIARKELRSYKQLPQIWYQIQTKFRDEPRPKSGLIRVRQFIMKDAYSFDIDAAGLDESYKKHYEVYCRIFDRCGLKYSVVEAHSGAMGGTQSHEFMVATEAGEDTVVSCPSCGYAANLEKASSKLAPVADLPGSGATEEIYTPGMKTIEDVSKFLGVATTQNMKTLVYVAEETEAASGAKKETKPQMVVVFLRGDHMLNEAKFETVVQKFTGRSKFRPAHETEIQQFFGADPGFLGPLHLPPTWQEKPAVVLADEAIKGRTNLIGGANKNDYHIRGLSPAKNFQVTDFVDVRSAAAGEGCVSCGNALVVGKAMEIGHIFKLGYKYAKALGATVLDKEGKEVTVIMGSYGIGVERILAAAIEQNNDKDGFWLPRSIAPFDVVVTPTNVNEASLLQTAEEVGRQLETMGYSVLLDDRDERPGVKFKDADLVGIPYRINVGKKVTEGKVELVTRSTRATQDATIAAIGAQFKEIARS
jgi:prolyl-tRNA synthetase